MSKVKKLTGNIPELGGEVTAELHGGEAVLNGYGKYYFSEVLKTQMRRYLARLLNLADANCNSLEQRTAMKGLIRDFSNDAYHKMHREMEEYLKDWKVLNRGEGGSIDEL